jgi:aspartyl-tRNA(Asn)/glutamyl-tRNA(Gln) amidotransferase subunit A
LAKYDGVRYGTRTFGPDAEGGILYAKTRSEGFGPEVKRRILLGSYTLSAAAMDSYFIKAQRMRRLVQREFDQVFRTRNALLCNNLDQKPDGVDVLVCPTAASLPPKLSEVGNLDPVQNYVTDVFTVPASLAGLPALSVPLAGGEDGSPRGNIGMQIIGQYGMDDTVLEVGRIFEDLGLTKAARSSIVESKSLEEAGHSPPLKWPEDLAKAYVNMSRYYGGGMAAIYYKMTDKKLPPVSWRFKD